MAGPRRLTDGGGTKATPNPMQIATGRAVIAAGQAIAALHPRPVSAAVPKPVPKAKPTAALKPSRTGGAGFGGHTPEPIPTKSHAPKPASKPTTKPARRAEPVGTAKPRAHAAPNSPSKPRTHAAAGSNAQIADATRALYRANKGTIGTNRNLLHVGSTLKVGSGTYKVKRGDTLWGIASRKGVTRKAKHKSAGSKDIVS